MSNLNYQLVFRLLVGQNVVYGVYKCISSDFNVQQQLKKFMGGTFAKAQQLFKY